MLTRGQLKRAGLHPAQVTLWDCLVECGQWRSGQSNLCGHPTLPTLEGSAVFWPSQHGNSFKRAVSENLERSGLANTGAVTQNLRLTTAAPGSHLLSSKVMGQKAWRAWEESQETQAAVYPCTDLVVTLGNHFQSLRVPPLN